MQRIRVERKPAGKPRPRPEILPLDARDPDIARAKALIARDPSSARRDRAT
jgi:hypothetical protein